MAARTSSAGLRRSALETACDASRGCGRVRACRVLCCRSPARLRPAGRGGHDRAPAHSVVPRPPRRRPRPPEDQGGLEGVRADRRPARVPPPRRGRGRPRSSARRPGPAVRRRRLRGGRADRSPHGHPGRGSPRFLGRHRARRLVQRPPRLPGARVRPLRQAGGRRRSRQRRARRRAHAGAVAGRDPADRHDRRGDRGDPRLGDRGDRPVGTARSRSGGLHHAGAEGARRARRRGRDRRPGGARARRCERGLARARHEGAPKRRGPARVRRAVTVRQEAHDPAALLRLAGRSSARSGSRASRSSATGWSPTSRGA